MEVQEIKNLLAKHRLAPDRSRGQNFLLAENIIQKIIAAAKLKKGDTVLEVGPGFGFLTKELAAAAGRVVAVESDKRLAAFLKAEFFQAGNLELIEKDILKLNLADLGLKPFSYQVVSNLPYNITSIFLRLFLEQAIKPREMVLMVQKEVAERIVASAGQMSLLALSAQFYSQPELLFEVDKSCFWPKPQVDSAVIRLKIKDKLPLAPEEIKAFFRLAKMGFAAKRKQLKNNLAAGLSLSAADIGKIFVSLGWPETVRAQNLSSEDWLRLVVILNDKF